MKVAFIGFSDLGNYIKDLLMDFHPLREEDMIYFDDNQYQTNSYNALPFNDCFDDKYRDYSFYVCLGYRHLEVKRNIITKLLELGRKVPYFVHPSAYVHPSVKIGSGSFIYPGCNIDRNTEIGIGAWIANGDIIAHDCVVGACCWFGASVTLSGKVKVGDGTFIGSGTTVANDVVIGNNIVVGMSSAITKDLQDEVHAIGNPLRILNKKINLV